MIRRALTLITTTTLATSLTACTSGSATPTPFTPSPAPTTVTTEPSPSPQQAASEAAQAGYRRYISAKVATQASGGTSTDELAKVAAGAILGAELNQAEIFRARKWRGVGQIEVVWTKALKIGPAGADGQIGEVTVQACLDSSKSTAVDAAGKSIKKAGTPTRFLDDMQMRFTGGAWKAYYGLNKAATC